MAHVLSMQRVQRVPRAVCETTEPIAACMVCIKYATCKMGAGRLEDGGGRTVVNNDDEVRGTDAKDYPI